MQKVAIQHYQYTKIVKVPYIHLSFDSILNQTYKNIHLYVGWMALLGEDLEIASRGNMRQNDKGNLVYLVSLKIEDCLAIMLE